MEDAPLNCCSLAWRSYSVSLSLPPWKSLEEMALALPKRCCATAGSPTSCVPRLLLLEPPALSKLVLFSELLPVPPDEKKSLPLVLSVRWPSLPRCTLGAGASVMVSYAKREPAGDLPGATSGDTPAPPPAVCSGSDTLTGSGAGACSNSESSALASSFLMPSPSLPPPAFLAAGAVDDRRALAAACVVPAGLGCAAAAPLSPPSEVRATATGAGWLEGEVGLESPKPCVPSPLMCLKSASSPAAAVCACPVAAATAAWGVTLDASFSSMARYSCAARDVYLDSILSDPTSSQPCCLKNWRARWFPPIAIIFSCS
mmetsp:Transcript_9102/g.22555  ORF Transcript_9102/g.22555 Transcript_9102/m.22555 type:complete len:315 (+) Transcript_9102:775-1719(+)